MKQCIFYLPYKLDEHGAGARMMRPRKMAQAFRDIGYEVTMISGTSSERRGLIHDVKKRITAGEKFDFLYMESHTEPTLLTDPSHLPTHPFLDYGFLKYAKKNGIPIGLFYSDLFWKYDGYGSGLPEWKKKSALKCYGYDIRQYEKLLQKFYVPDVKTFSEVIGSEKLTSIMSELSPGAENLQVPEKNEVKAPLTVFYVGGLGGNYQIAELVKAVHDSENVRLILCCREAEWEREKPGFAEYLCDRIEVIHKSGDELAEYYDTADIGSLLFKRGSYIDMAKPFKAYEYLGHELPVMSTKGTAIGSFVEKNDIGWNIAYSAKAIQRVFREIFEDPALLPQKRRNCKYAKAENLWTCRAEQVVRDLVK
ncbi:MAG: glycosyltransferase family 1 protein [Clostridia bacterium]|nr:glycosyltransferase family 1 protein [Clostridia bacterium]